MSFDRYPENFGAVAGTRIQYNSVAAAIEDYGATVDRVGPECGGVLHLRIDGEASTFEDRSLPVSALQQRYHTYTLSAEAPGGLPTGWVLELSKVAPWFGRDGGAIQIRALDDTGKEVSVTDLRDLGIVTK